MEKKIQVLITFSALILLIAGLYIFTNWFSLITGYFTGESEQEKIAFCLRDQGTQYYFTLYCAECEKQDKELGRYSKTISRLDCGNEMQNCPNVREVPAWYIPNSKDKIYYGYKTFEELKQLGDCR